MDYYINQLKLLFEQNGGIVSAQDIQKAGIDRLSLYNCLAKGVITKESHGNYVLTDDKPDEFKIIQSRSEKLVFSHGTVLFLHGMSDRVPHNLDITVPQGDNVSRIKKMLQILQIRQLYQLMYRCLIYYGIIRKRNSALQTKQSFFTESQRGFRKRMQSVSIPLIQNA